MKLKNYLPFLLFAGAALAGCKKFTQLANIDRNIPYSYQLEVPEIPGGIFIPPGGFKYSLSTYGFATNSDEYVNEAGSREDLIVHVKLSDLLLRMQQPDTATFDFVDTIRMYISADGIPEQLAAYKYGITDGVDSVALDVVDADLKEYFKKDSMYLRLEGHFLDLPPKNAKMDVNTVFSLRANPLN